PAPEASCSLLGCAARLPCGFGSAQQHLPTPILLIAGLIRLFADRPFLSVGDDRQPIGSHAKLSKIVPSRLGPLLAQHNVVGLGAPLVGMPSNFEAGVGVCFDPFSIPRQRLHALFRQGPAVKGKEDIVESCCSSSRLLTANFCFFLAATLGRLRLGDHGSPAQSLLGRGLPWLETFKPS